MEFSQFKNLFTPVEVGPVTLRNRIFVTPHATMFASDERNYLPGETLAHYCAERARGGASLIEVSMATVGFDTTSQTAPSAEAHFSPLNGGHPMILTGRWPIRGSDPAVVKGYSRLARAVHEYGAKCFIELASAGSNLGSELGVSAFPWPSPTPFTSREMTEEAIERAVEDYRIASKYVREGGLDGVDILTSHGELIGEFISAVMNRRKDGYGGSLGNRLRFLEEVIQRIREEVGGSLAVGMRLNGDEKFAGGNTPEDATEIARRLDGKLDWITTDVGYSPQQEGWQAVPMYIDSGYNLRLTAPMKRAVRSTKIGAVGRYVDPYFAERLLADGLADMVAMTRALIADPELPNKTLDGRLDDIRPCIGVLQDCWGRMNRGLPISCTVNPVVSREGTWGFGSIRQAPVKKNVLVIGSGPAGLEAARIASERGHRVFVYEKGEKVGGQALLAARLPGRGDIKAIVNWQESQLKKLGVEIRYRFEVTPDPDVIDYVLSEERPDTVVIATGSSPIRNGFQPYTFNPIEGWDSPSVLTDVDVLERGPSGVGQKVLVCDSLGFVEAPGIAELLAKNGKQVEIVTLHANIGLELRLINHWDHLLPRLFAVDVTITPFTWVKKIHGRMVTLYNVYYEQRQRVVDDVDNVVLITGKMQNDALYGAFKGKAKELQLIGDANIGGSRIGNAIYDGQKVGRIL